MYTFWGRVCITLQIFLFCLFSSILISNIWIANNTVQQMVSVFCMYILYFATYILYFAKSKFAFCFICTFLGVNDRSIYNFRVKSLVSEATSLCSSHFLLEHFNSWTTVALRFVCAYSPVCWSFVVVSILMLLVTQQDFCSVLPVILWWIEK